METRCVYFIGDGARWIRGIRERYFPSAVGVLDVWHLERELKRVFGLAGRGVVEELKGLALGGRAAEIIARLKHEALRLRGEGRRRVIELIRYVRSNSDWIENIPRVGGYGSGPVEKTVDITVARRFKRRGMSWYRCGANPLLKLNGEWERYWSGRREELARYAA